MNFEHLLKLINNHFFVIKKNFFLKKKIQIFINNYFFNLNLKLKKLKLGLVHFEIKQFFFANIFLYDMLEMRYVRQDTTEEDELKLEKRLDAIKWKWDFQNVAAFLIISIIIWFIFKNYLDFVIKELFYSFYEIEKFDALSLYTFKSSFQCNILKTLECFKIVNELFVKSLLSGFMHFKFF